MTPAQPSFPPSEHPDAPVGPARVAAQRAARTNPDFHAGPRLLVAAAVLALLVVVGGIFLLVGALA